MSPSTFAISTYSQNIMYQIPIIHSDHSAIIGFGSPINKENNNYVIANIVFDHSFLNGIYVSNFLDSLIKYLLSLK